MAATVVFVPPIAARVHVCVVIMFRWKPASVFPGAGGRAPDAEVIGAFVCNAEKEPEAGAILPPEGPSQAS
ncbi:MAG TPA: hypothetical protein VG758_24080 [Hyphomicrobiaceae bacterium]|nr:hypothetical protein [Hyphomicrobiaceae bacterium]